MNVWRRQARKEVGLLFRCALLVRRGIVEEKNNQFWGSGLPFAHVIEIVRCELRSKLAAF